MSGWAEGYFCVQTRGLKKDSTTDKIVLSQTAERCACTANKNDDVKRRCCVLFLEVL